MFMFELQGRWINPLNIERMYYNYDDVVVIEFVSGNISETFNISRSEFSELISDIGSS